MLVAATQDRRVVGRVLGGVHTGFAWLGPNLVRVFTPFTPVRPPPRQRERHTRSAYLDVGWTEPPGLAVLGQICKHCCAALSLQVWGAHSSYKIQTHSSA